MEAVPRPARAGRARRRTARLLAAAEALARRLGHPHALGMATLAKGAAEFLEGRFLAGVEFSDRAAAILREHCTGVDLGARHGAAFALWSLIYTGRLGELPRRTPLLVQEARERGDLYMETTIEVYLAVARPPGRRSGRRGAGAGGRGDRAVVAAGVPRPAPDAFFGLTYIDLYAGDAAGAWRRVREVEPAVAGVAAAADPVRADRRAGAQRPGGRGGGGRGPRPAAVAPRRGGLRPASGPRAAAVGLPPWPC